MFLIWFAEMKGTLIRVGVSFILYLAYGGEGFLYWRTAGSCADGGFFVLAYGLQGDILYEDPRRGALCGRHQKG